jgi:rhodanese-related sulfurtransferase
LCSHGMRASQAAAALQEQAGFTSVYVFPGGFEGHHMQGYPGGEGWKAAGLPVEDW